MPSLNSATTAHKPLPATRPRFPVEMMPSVPGSSLIRCARRGRPPRALRAGRVTVHLNGRNALWHAIKTLDLPSEANVLVPSYACGTEVDAILHADVAVKFYGVLQSTAINVEHLLNVMDARTGAVLVTHYFGFPQPDLPIVTEICHRRGLVLIEDCAHALYSGMRGRAVGSFGDLAVFTPNKLLPLPNVGLLRCNNPALSTRSSTLAPRAALDWSTTLELMKPRLVRHGLAGRVLNRFFVRPVSRFLLRRSARSPRARFQQTTFGTPVFNHLTTDFGTSRLAWYLWKRSAHGQAVLHRRRNFRYLSERLRDIDSFRPLFDELLPGVCPLNFPGLVESPGDFCGYLKSRRVMAEAWWNLTHHMVPAELFPETVWLKKHVIVLPIHQDLDLADLDTIVAAVRDWANQQARPAPDPIKLASGAT